MQENIALVKKKQKSFNSSVKQFKNLLKKGSITVKNKAVPAKISKKITKRAQRPRGIVYIGNIPHGFYERELIGYFGQFGVVTRVRCARSKKTGSSKGYAFIEFQDPEVASIVAETMNNYLMGKRLLKAQYISPEEQANKSYFKGKNYTPDRYPTLINRIKNKKDHNAILSEELVKEKTMRMFKSIEKTQKKLKDLNIFYDFKPVDVPSYVDKLDNEGNDVDSKIASSDDEDLDNSDDSIVFTPPEEMLKLVRKKISSLNGPAMKLKQKKKSKSKVGSDVDIKVSDQNLKQFKVTLNDSDLQPKKKQKLVGVSKNKFKLTKSAKLTDKKTKLIKQEFNNQEQFTLKTPKSIKTEVIPSNKMKSKSHNKPKSPKKNKSSPAKTRLSKNKSA